MQHIYQTHRTKPYFPEVENSLSITQFDLAKLISDGVC
ncbi:hypothetical protein T11_4160 [Trichinella zimbabwensis]|uniref:Uncharacterized protein n=1 Tax=Trichinella zimbabwensis TaxID=268475 RepID=A0A0V1G785_9BILA|nr:hypothetical protein T11_4160 [Trichinella zimbabwensis]